MRQVLPFLPNTFLVGIVVPFLIALRASLLLHIVITQEHGSQISHYETDEALTLMAIARARLPGNSSRVKLLTKTNAGSSSSSSTGVVTGENMTQRTNSSSPGSSRQTKPSVKHPTEAMNSSVHQSISSSSNNRSSSSSSDCFRHNSQAWLDGPRLGNVNDPFFMDQTQSDYYVKLMILDAPNMLLSMSDNSTSNNRGGSSTIPSAASFYMSQTLCHEQSKFRNLSDTNNVELEEEQGLEQQQQQQQWVFRLVYLATHYHQHRHAIAEAQARLFSTKSNNDCQNELQQRGIGRFDFECPNTKFLVIALGSGFGLGINIRGMAVKAMLAALASDRVLLILSNTTNVGPAPLLFKPWPLASCDRGDFQCFFAPPTPCVLTHKDLEAAYTLSKKEIRMLTKQQKKKTGGDKSKASTADKIVYAHADEKVWYMELEGFSRQEIPIPAALQLQQHALALIRALPESDARLAILSRAVDNMAIRVDEKEQGASGAAVEVALAIFFLRPNLRQAEKMNEILNDISKGVDPDRSIGLPIRASDKCGHESECISFANHMKAVSDLVTTDNRFRFGKNHTLVGPTIIFTTESRSMFQEQLDYAANSSARKAIPFEFRIAANTHDVLPDTGALEHRKSQLKLSPDDVMLSAISTLKFQLLSRATIGNCCSNFHILLKQLLLGGCGAARTNHFHCMQDNNDPSLRMCCVWQKECISDKRLALEKVNNNSAIIKHLKQMQDRSSP